MARRPRARGARPHLTRVPAPADPRDAARATAAQMTAAGLPIEVVQLANPDQATRAGAGGNITKLGAADLALLTETIAKVSVSPVPGS